MMKAREYSLRDVAERCFSRQEIKQNIQYNLICEHNFEAVFEIIERALSLCLLGCCVAAMQTAENKHRACALWRRYCFH